ncbi:MAG: hypothetical protein L0H83_03495 [Salinisphaera sp.]|nr:hypothetical protein [Salinisphaera sp.]
MAKPKAVRDQEQAADAAMQPKDDDVTENPSMADAFERAQGDAPEQAQDEQEQASVPEKADRGQDADYWKSRFQVVEGKLKHEVPALHGEVKTLREQLQAAEAARAELAAKTDVKGVFSKDQIDEFGEDTLQMVYRTADRIANEKVAQAREEMAKELSSLRESTGQDREARFMGELDRLVPEWAQINEHQGFLQWLSEVDDFAGVQRQQLLEQAHQAMDAPRVARFFHTWQQANTKQPSPLPGRAAAGRPSTHENKATFSRADVGKFYEDVRRGKYRKDPAKRDQIEREIAAANAAGRIV